MRTSPHLIGSTEAFRDPNSSEMNSIAEVARAIAGPSRAEEPNLILVESSRPEPVERIHSEVRFRRG